MKKLLLWLPLECCFSACNSPVETGNKNEVVVQQKKVATAIEVATNSKAEILNTIIVNETGGIKITRAYLSFDDGKLVPKTNTVSLGEPVYLNLIINKSWLSHQGTTSMDASQKIMTNRGELVVSTPSLFQNIPPAIKKDFSHLYLQATISKTRTDIDYFIVHYRVWVKSGAGEVSGSYRLYINN